MEDKKTYLYAFEKLEVYQLAVQYSLELRPVLASFPSEEKYCLTTQLRRSAYSISANVAEGSGRASSADRAHFTNIAYCSALETINHLNHAVKQQYISTEVYDELRAEIEKIANKLNALYKYQLKEGKNLKTII